MDVDHRAIGGTVQEATRPRKSGVLQNSHAIRQSLEPIPDYEMMREVVEGKRRLDVGERKPANDE